jgi:ribosome-associated toxin RatA of RatAB toxin-antitoxin module
MIALNRRLSSCVGGSMRMMIGLWIAVFVVAAPTWAADATKPHDHQGSLKPYPEPPPPPQLSAAELAVLASGKPVMRTLDGAAGGRGAAVFRVNAPPEVTWKVINNFAAYPTYISEVKSCEVYNRSGNNIDTAFTIKALGVSVEYFIRHRFHQAERWGTWTLDYNRLSDVDDSVGFWRVTPVEGNPNQSQVEYSIDVILKGWVPGFVRTMMVDNGVTTATEWVTRAAEKRWEKQQAKAAATPPVEAPVAPAPAAPPATP